LHELEEAARFYAARRVRELDLLHRLGQQLNLIQVVVLGSTNEQRAGLGSTNEQRDDGAGQRTNSARVLGHRYLQVLSPIQPARHPTVDQDPLHVQSVDQEPCVLVAR
jgi:hypothetical protein